MKKCPFCAEDIKDEAVVCRYCGRDLEKASEAGHSRPPGTASGIRQPPKPKPKAGGSAWTQQISARFGCLMTFLVLVFLLVVVALWPRQEGGDDHAVPSGPREAAIARWLQANGGRTARVVESVPDWANGSRLSVTPSQGRDLLFYFARDGSLCAVWTVNPRERIFSDPACQ